MKFVVLNHKMNILYSDLDDYIKGLSKIKKNNIKLVICPSNIYLGEFVKNNFSVGAQDVSIYSGGSYTGEVSASQLKSLGVEYCLIGHSERREYFKEDSSDINKKLKQVLENNICPILCVGESFKDKEYGVGDEIIIRELEETTKGIKLELLKNIIVSYEPVWAIGSDVIPSSLYIEKKVDLIKEYFKNRELNSIKVLYGGSVNDINIEVLEHINNLDGYLIGGAGLDIEKMSNLTNKL